MRLWRIIIIFLFVVGVASSLVMYFLWFDLGSLFVQNQYGSVVLSLIFIAMYSLRNYFLVPPSMLTLLWGALFVHSERAFVIAMIGWMIGLAETYAIGMLLNKWRKWLKWLKWSAWSSWSDSEWHKWFAWSQKSLLYKTVGPLQSKAKKYGFWFVFFGCMFPFFPTDVICYTAWYIRYDFKKFFVAGVGGIIPLTLLYTLLGDRIVPYIQSLSLYGWVGIAVVFLLYAIWYYRQ